MEFIKDLAASLRRARTVELPQDETSAFYMLMSMVIANQYRSVSDLLGDSKYNVNYHHGRANRNLLHIAANCGSYECLHLLLKKGADVNHKDMSGCTALHLAARNGQRKCIMKLLEYKADVNIRNNEGLTTIHWLAVNGRTELLHDIFTYVKDVDVEDAQGQTALHVACQNGHKSTVLCLLDHGADVNRPNHYGWMPLHFACSHGQHDTANILLNKGAKFVPNRSNKTPMDVSVEGGYSETCYILLQHMPKLFDQLISMVRKETLKEAMYTKVLLYLIDKNRVMADKVLIQLSEEASNIGHNLLSVSSNVETQVSSLLRCVKTVCTLYKSMSNSSTSLQTSAINGVAPMSPKTAQIFKPLEMLWQLLDDWLNLLKMEFERNPENFKKEMSHQNEKSPVKDPNIGESLDSIKDNKIVKDVSMEKVETEEKVDLETEKKDEPESMGASVEWEITPSEGETTHHKVVAAKFTLADMEEQLLKRLSLEQADQDVVGVTLPRICGVVQAFYMCCSCQVQQEITSPRFIEFVWRHNHVLKALVSRNPKVIFDHFHFLLECPELMSQFLYIIKAQPFETRRHWFYENLGSTPDDNGLIHSTLNQEDILVVDRALKEKHKSARQLQPSTPVTLNKKRVIIHSPTPRKMKKALFSTPKKAAVFASPKQREHIACQKHFAHATTMTDETSIESVTKPRVKQKTSFSPNKVKVMYRTKKDSKVRAKVIYDGNSKQIIKNIAMHNSKERTAKLIMDSPLKEAVEKQVLKEMKNEIGRLTSTLNMSLLRRKDTRSLALFKFANLNTEVEIWAPFFHQCISMIVKNSTIGKAVASAILLKFHNQHMTAFQHVISQILDHGGATDETISTLNNLGMCVSTSTTSRTTKELVERQMAHTKALMVEEKEQLEKSVHLSKIL